MLDEDSNSKNTDNGSKKPAGTGFNKVPTFTLLAWAGIIALTVVLFMMRSRVAPATTLSQSDFLQKFQSNQIVHATINLGGQSSLLTPITGTFMARRMPC